MFHSLPVFLEYCTLNCLNEQLCTCTPLFSMQHEHRKTIKFDEFPHAWDPGEGSTRSPHSGHVEDSEKPLKSMGLKIISFDFFGLLSDILIHSL
jgi:hypothetical protein